MIKIKKIPLLRHDECKEIFTNEDCWVGYYSIKPIYKLLPNIQNLDEEERKDYKFKNLTEGMYLVGIELISDKWVNIGFCSYLLSNFGLVLEEANPIIKKIDSKYNDESMIMLKFKHIAFSIQKENFSLTL